MTPDTSQAPPASRRRARHGGSAGPVVDGGAPADVEGLSAAVRSTGRVGPDDRRLPRPRIPTLLLIVLPVAVGATAAALMPREYRCSASFQVDTARDAEAVARYRRALLEFMWVYEAARAAGAPPLEMEGDSDSTQLRLTLTTRDAPGGLDRIKTLAAEFIAGVERRAVQKAAALTPAEAALSDLVRSLTDRLSTARESMDVAVRSLPADDPTLLRQDLMQRWVRMRGEFDSVRGRLEASTNAFADLQAAPEPEYGLITADERRRAIESDPTLQHDVAQLSLELVRLRLHMLNVWQRCAGPLDRLVRATGESVRLIARSADSPVAAESDGMIRELIEAVKAYQATLTAFAAEWTTAFTTLQHTEPDPYRPEFVEQYQQVRLSLNRFLFQSARDLTAARTRLAALGNRTDDDARFHVLRATLLRSLQTMQTGHHRFEFAAAALDTPDNFRLDAAMKSARGLRRRTRERLDAIDHRLQEAALARARREHYDRLDDSRTLVERARSDLRRTAEQLVDVQEALNHRADESDAFQAALRTVDAESIRVDHLEEWAGAIQDRLRGLEYERFAAADIAIELVGCDRRMATIPIAQRLQVGGEAGASTLLALLLIRTVWPHRPDRRRLPRATVAAG